MQEHVHVTGPGQPIPQHSAHTKPNSGEIACRVSCDSYSVFIVSNCAISASDTFTGVLRVCNIHSIPWMLVGPIANVYVTRDCSVAIRRRQVCTASNIFRTTQIVFDPPRGMWVTLFAKTTHCTLRNSEPKCTSSNVPHPCIPFTKVHGKFSFAITFYHNHLASFEHLHVFFTRLAIQPTDIKNIVFIYFVFQKHSVIVNDSVSTNVSTVRF